MARSSDRLRAAAAAFHSCRLAQSQAAAMALGAVQAPRGGGVARGGGGGGAPRGAWRAIPVVARDAPRCRGNSRETARLETTVATSARRRGSSAPNKKPRYRSPPPPTRAAQQTCGGDGGPPALTAVAARDARRPAAPAASGSPLALLERRRRRRVGGTRPVVQAVAATLNMTPPLATGGATMRASPPFHLPRYQAAALAWLHLTRLSLIPKPGRRQEQCSLDDQPRQVAARACERAVAHAVAGGRHAIHRPSTSDARRPAPA